MVKIKFSKEYDETKKNFLFKVECEGVELSLMTVIIDNLRAFGDTLPAGDYVADFDEKSNSLKITNAKVEA